MPTDFTLVPGSEKVTIGTPRTDGAAVVFPVTATASQVRQLDPDTLRQQVLGKSVDEARSILAQDGTVGNPDLAGLRGHDPEPGLAAHADGRHERDHGLARTGRFPERRHGPAVDPPIEARPAGRPRLRRPDPRRVVAGRGRSNG